MSVAQNDRSKKFSNGLGDVLVVDDSATKDLE